MLHLFRTVAVNQGLGGDETESTCVSVSPSDTVLSDCAFPIDAIAAKFAIHAGANFHSLGSFDKRKKP